MLPLCRQPEHLLSHGHAPSFTLSNTWTRHRNIRTWKASPSSSTIAAAAARPQPDALQSRSAVVSDQNVPEGHKGLHGFLYGDQGADVHDSSSVSSVKNSEEDDGSSVVSLPNYITSREASKFAGIYSVYDSQSSLQYIGYSRNVVVSLRSHLERLGVEKCSFVRVKMFTDPHMISRNRLDEERKAWLSLSDVLPPGNSIENHLWESKDAVMSEAEKILYEEKKLKLRKAMGENLYDDVEGEEEDAKTRRLKLIQATEGDDWSGVIDGQTRDVVENTAKKSASAVSSPIIVSPFENESSKSSTPGNGLYAAETFELTVENVDMVLNEVRPYLIADGGNVEVVSVDNGIVALRLQGACGTCPSSTVTMKMGIERVLKEKFEDAVKEVIQVDQQQIHATVMAVNAHLDILRPAIQNYGGSVNVLSVQDGECKVQFKGPPPIGMGIQAAIKDKFPDVKSVLLVDT